MGMEVRPRLPEYGSGLSAALFVAFPMLQSGLSDHSHWRDNYFLGGFIVVALMSIAGLAAFFWHWRWRVIAPLLVFTAYGLITFSAPSAGVLVALALAAIVTGYFVSPDREKRVVVQPVNAPPGQELGALNTERDAALARISELEAVTSSQYPDFHATVFEIQNQEPVTGQDMFAAIVIEVLNNGHKSSCKAFRASALTPYGRTIKIDVLGNAFRLPVNGGKDCFDYLPEHYIMNRTYPRPVERGESVTGILPCVFREITNAKDIDLRTLKVEFSDVIGNADGKGKWWSTDAIEGVQWEDPIPVKHRPTLPILQQPCGNPASPRSSLETNPHERAVQEIAPVAAAYRETAALMTTLRILAVRMENALSEAPGGSVKAFVSAMDPLNYEFKHDHLPRVIEQKDKLRTGFQLIKPELSDESLTADFYGPDEIKRLAWGFEQMLDELGLTLQEKASKL